MAARSKVRNAVSAFLVTLVIASVAVPGALLTTSGTAHASAPIATWTQVNPATLPDGRSGATMAYDPATHQIVLFGGSTTAATTASGADSDTWTWDGTTWTHQLPAASPPARLYASMAFDPVTNTMILFGGLDGTGLVALDDTWSWNGITWTQRLPASSPPARINAQMSTDQQSSQVVLFGGVDATGLSALGDTWTWDGTTWTQLSPAASPAPRSQASMDYDQATGQLVLFGGLDTTGLVALGDTWTWDGTTWAQRSPAASPAPRSQASMDYDPEAAIGQNVLFGGLDGNGNVLGDTWTWDGTTWAQASPASSPPARSYANVTYDPSSTRLILFGGLDATQQINLGDMWSFVPATVPGAPTIGGVTAGDAKATVTFAAPAQDGGSPINSYTVTATDSTRPAAPVVVQSGPTSPLVLVGLTDGDTYTATVTATNAVGNGQASSPSHPFTPTAPPPPAPPPPPSTTGYRLVASDGGVFSYGGTPYYGSTGGQPLVRPIVGMASTPGGKGYWLVASDGGIFAYGDAGFYGSTGGQTLNKPIVGMAATADGKGYWLVASDGGIFTYGDAGFYGSTGGQTLNKPIVGMAATADGKGYWLVASDGGIFAYGDAVFHGSTGGTTLNEPIVGMARTFDGQGYWLVASDGGIFAYGDAVFHGSTGAQSLNEPIVGMAATADGTGYWLVASDGGIFAYGDAVFHGSTGGQTLNKPIVGMAAVPAVIPG